MYISGNENAKPYMTANRAVLSIGLSVRATMRVERGGFVKLLMKYHSGVVMGGGRLSFMLAPHAPYTATLNI
jgi:hypothetical protein